MSKILLITPPFLQFNNPYPAMPYIKGYLTKRGYDADHLDLNIDTARNIYSSKFLERIFDLAHSRKLLEPFPRFYIEKKRYIHTIDSVINFLSGRNQSLAHRIVSRDFLPEGPRFSKVNESEEFSLFDTADRAKYFATLYLEDISDAYRSLIDPGFGIVRYRESLGISASFFSEIEDKLSGKYTEIENEMLDILKIKVEELKPEVVIFTVPFPGNLFLALRCADYIKKNYPEINIIAGGGYVNTELREISSREFFNYVDYLVFDDGEKPIEHLLKYIRGNEPEDKLFNTVFLKDGEICRSPFIESAVTDEIYAPDYSHIDTLKYISMFDTANPMVRLWNDGYWNKLTLAHGCYWAGCSFCDTKIDYICNYRSFSVESIIEKMKRAISETGETGFHFTDEAAPPALLKKLAIAILQEGITCTWWTNVRFEESFTPDLAKLLAMSGCIAVAGGIEAAAPRILKLINKGVSLENISRSCHNFSSAGILVHGYLMYGYPTQNEKETVQALEIVRQLFKNRCIDSAYWHRFSLTCHSAVYDDPEKYEITIDEWKGDFAKNDMQYRNKIKTDHSKFSGPLKRGLESYMAGLEMDLPVEKWFQRNSPKSGVDSDLIESFINTEAAERGNSIFISALPQIFKEKGGGYISFRVFGNEYTIEVKESDYNGVINFYKKYGLYEKSSKERILADLSSAVGMTVKEMKVTELYMFLREFSIMVI